MVNIEAKSWAGNAKCCWMVLVAALGVSPVIADTDDAGQVFNVLLPAAALSATYLVEDDRTGTMQFIKSAVVAELTTELLKTTINKERPSGNCCSSFPSGHATRAFYSAAFIHRRYGKKWGLPAYALAGVVAYSRVEGDHHDEVDVLAGALIGWLSSRYFTTRHDVQIRPMEDAIGLVFERRF